MKPLALSLLLVSAALLLPAQVGTPLAGWVRDAGGVVRSVAGVSGAFLLPAVPGFQATWGGFSGHAGLWQTADRLVLTDALGVEQDSYPSPEGPLTAAFAASGQSGLVWLGTTGELLAFPGWSPQPLPDWNGTPLALALSRARLRAVVQRDGGLWLVESRLADARVVQERLLPGMEAPVFLADNGSILHTLDGAVALTLPGGEEQRIETPLRPEAFERMGAGWIALRCGGIVFALHRETLQLHRLPAAMPLSGGGQ